MGTKSAGLLALMLACSFIAHVHAQSDLTITSFSATTETPYTGELVTFSATATSSAGAVTYTWSFDDETPDAAGGLVQHAFAVEDLYVVTLTVSDGVSSATDSFIIDAIDQPVATAAQGEDVGDMEVNPDTGLEVSVIQQQSSIVQLSINDANFSRILGRTFSTDFGDGTSPVGGNKPRHEFDNEGIFIAKVSVEESGSETGKIRKQLTVSSDQVGTPRRVSDLPSSRKIAVDKVKGKFNFESVNKSDSVSVTFSIELPAGLDLSVPQPMSVAVGNITETVEVDRKGRGTAVGRFKKVSIKFPKLAKGTTTTVAGQLAKVTVSMSAADLDSSGFDTEGISPQASSAKPKIQFAMLLGGVSYSDEAEVSFKVSTKGDTGIIGRSASR
jgi:PKD repeat protein